MNYTLLDQVLAAANPAGNVRASVATIVGVASSGFVDLDVGGSVVGAVPTLKQYTAPSVGDVVLVLKVDTAWVVAGALSGGGVATATNMAFNPSFELGYVGDIQPNGWGGTYVVNGGSPSIVVADGHTGSQSLRMDVIQGKARIVVMSSPVSMTPNVTHEAGVWVRASTFLANGEKCRLEIWQGRSASEAVSVPSTTPPQVNITPTLDWRYYATTFIPTDDAPWVNLALVADGVSATVARSGVFVCFDDVVLR